MHADAPGVLGEAGRKDSSRSTTGLVRCFEAIEVLGQLSDTVASKVVLA